MGFFGSLMKEAAKELGKAALESLLDDGEEEEETKRPLTEKERQFSDLCVKASLEELEEVSKITEGKMHEIALSAISWRKKEISKLEDGTLVADIAGRDPEYAAGCYRLLFSCGKHTYGLDYQKRLLKAYRAGLPKCGDAVKMTNEWFEKYVTHTSWDILVSIDKELKDCLSKTEEQLLKKALDIRLYVINKVTDSVSELSDEEFKMCYSMIRMDYMRPYEEQFFGEYGDKLYDICVDEWDNRDEALWNDFYYNDLADEIRFYKELDNESFLQACGLLKDASENDLRYSFDDLPLYRDMFTDIIIAEEKERRGLK